MALSKRTLCCHLYRIKSLCREPAWTALGKDLLCREPTSTALGKDDVNIDVPRRRRGLCRGRFWLSAKSLPRACHMALGKEFFAESSLPRASWQTLGEDFAEGFEAFAEGSRLSAKKPDPVVYPVLANSPLNSTPLPDSIRILTRVLTRWHMIKEIRRMLHENW